MRIEPGNSAQRIWELYKSYRVSVGKKSAAEDAHDDKDGIMLSDEARLYQEIITAAKSAPDIRPYKVDDLRKAISNGTYTIDAGKIAEAMIEETSFDKKA